MKVIIDIPDNVYIACNEYKDNTNIGILQRILYIAISNGTPLEDIKAEIEELIQHCDPDYDFEEIFGIRHAIEIIDKHIKGE